MATRKAQPSERAVVASPFTGTAEGGRVFMPGEVFEGAPERVAELAGLGYLVRAEGGGEVG